MLRKIHNIVFYKVFDEIGESKFAAIFYNDGTVRNVSFEEGIDACEEVCRERNITTRDAFDEMINRDVVHIVSAREFVENFNSYLGTPSLEDEIFEPEIHPVDEAMLNPEPQRVIHPIADDLEPAPELDPEPVVEDEPVVDVEPVVEDEPVVDVEPVVEPEPELEPVTDVDLDCEPELDPVDDDDLEPIDDTYDVVEEPVEEESEGLFAAIWNTLKNNGIVKAVVAVGLALAIIVGINSCNKRKTIEGTMFRSNLTTSDTNLDNTDDDVLAFDATKSIQPSNEDTKKAPEDTSKKATEETPAVVTDLTYKTDAENTPVTATELTFETAPEDTTTKSTQNRIFSEDTIISYLLSKTNNAFQKRAMTNLGYTMDAFNNEFADYYVEEGKDIRPSLKFEEVVALQVAYNDYSKEELQAYFNGADIRAGDLQRAYKDASLQLMGAYAIENSEHPIDMSELIESDMGKEFYRTYHEMFLKAKESTGEEKIQWVTEFYKAVRRDFPVTQEVRTEGISHSENYESLEAYKLSVTPMIAAAEMMWQNLDIDVTLDDMEVDFLNDLGLCNYADKSFERAEMIALTHDTDTSNPTYDEYKDAFERYYTRLGTYYIDDDHRELTKLDSFQNAVNWHFETDGWVREGTTVVPSTDTHDETHTWSESETTYYEESTETEKPIPDSVKDEVDQQIAAENERARQEAEAAAAAERDRLQQEADQDAQKIEEEIIEDEEDLQEKIDHANEQIDHNNEDDNPLNDKPVNEDDLGHGVDFDDDHSNDKGDLDPSVENITTDPTGDMTNEPLPDPNITGSEFDLQGEQIPAPVVDYEEDVEDIVIPTDDDVVLDEENEWVDSVLVDDDTYYEDAWIEYEDGSYDSVVDSYVDSLADSPETEEGYQYHK